MLLVINVQPDARLKLKKQKKGAGTGLDITLILRRSGSFISFIRAPKELAGYSSLARSHCPAAAAPHAPGAGKKIESDTVIAGS